MDLWPFPPGVFVTILGTEALIITLIPADRMRGRLARLIAVVLCFGLAFGEIYAVRRDRADASNQHAIEMATLYAKFLELNKNVIALQNNTAATNATRSLPADNLKRQAVDLSNEILSFLISREAPPGYGQGGYGEGPYGGKPADTKDYDAQTMRSYFDAFQIRVDRMHDELKKQGLTDSEFDTEYSNTVNTYSIRTIAERIGALAKKLPN